MPLGHYPTRYLPVHMDLEPKEVVLILSGRLMSALRLGWGPGSGGWAGLLAFNIITFGLAPGDIYS